MTSDDIEEIGKEPSWLSLVHAVSIIVIISIVIVVLRSIQYSDVYHSTMTFELSPPAQLVRLDSGMRPSLQFKTGSVVNAGDFIGYLRYDHDSIVAHINGVLVFDDQKIGSCCGKEPVFLSVIPSDAILTGVAKERVKAPPMFTQGRSNYILINYRGWTSAITRSDIHFEPDSVDRNKLKVSVTIPFLASFKNVGMDNNVFASDVEIKGGPISLWARLLKNND